MDDGNGGLDQASTLFSMALGREKADSQTGSSRSPRPIGQNSEDGNDIYVVGRSTPLTSGLALSQPRA